MTHKTERKKKKYPVLFPSTIQQTKTYLIVDSMRHAKKARILE